MPDNTIFTRISNHISKDNTDIKNEILERNKISIFGDNFLHV